MTDRPAEERAPAISRGAALDMLEDTHVYFTSQAAIQIQEAFGIVPRLQHIKANTGEPKGLEVDGVGRNAKVAGYASHDLARAICSKLGLTVPEFHGRGSQQRACVAAIRATLT